MTFIRPLKFIAALLSVIGISSVLSVAVTTQDFSESYPAVVCPPTLDGLASQISFSSKKTPFQRLQNRTTKTSQVKVLRLPVKKDSLVFPQRELHQWSGKAEQEVGPGEPYVWALHRHSGLSAALRM
jgi:hypothetical protein